jgi:DNA-binding MarR family transcriptional regulator
MAGERSKAAQELMEAFSRFSRLHWHQNPGVGLRPREIMVLHWIRRMTGAEAAGITVSELSGILGVTSPTVTQLLNGLEADGFVARTTDENDRRAVRIKLTDKGESAISKALDGLFASFAGLVEYLGEEDSHQLAGLLSRVFTYFSLNRRRDS